VALQASGRGSIPRRSTTQYTQGNIMFTPEFYIDSLQATKKALTNQIYTDPKLNKAAMKFIDAQTQFAKMLVQNSIDMAKYSVDGFANLAYPTKAKAKAE